MLTELSSIPDMHTIFSVHPYYETTILTFICS
jgi:hypothetical protein